MTEAEKKAIYDKEYAKSLEWLKNKFSNYEPYLRIPLKERWEILEHFKSIFTIMKKCGICRFDGEEPMSNVSDFLVKFKKKGDPDSLDDLLISNHDSCWTTVMFERTQEAALRWKLTWQSCERSKMLKKLRKSAKSKKNGKLGRKRKKSGELSARKTWMNGSLERTTRKQSLKLGMMASCLSLTKSELEKSIGMLMSI